MAVAVVAAAVGFFWKYPLFRIVPLAGPGAGDTELPATVAFDAAAVAAKIWETDLRAAADRAVELKSFAGFLRENPVEAKKRFAKSTDLGAAYYFVRGTGRVIAVDRNSVRIALDGPDRAIVALRTGPVFGNAVRDGSGVLDVNAFPGLQEFNALAAELNALVEKKVIPGLREKATVGAEISFAGCAEAPETAGGADEPILTLVPVQAGLRQ